MQVLLLGATGLLGNNVLRSLLERGHRVVVLVRSNTLDLQHPDLEIVKGSILDVVELRNAARGCDAIINCAGTTDMSLLHYEDYLPVNKSLCEYILEVMNELDIKILIHTSTANTIGYGSARRAGVESDDIEPPFSSSYYAQSKLEAERILIWEAQQNPKRHILLLNPGFMIGRYDAKPSSGKLLLTGFKRRIMAVSGGGKSFVNVKDVAEAAVNGLTAGRSGERYLLTGQNMTLKDFYILQAEVCGYSQKIMILPDWLVSLAGRVGDLMRWLGIATQLSTRNVRQLQVKEYYSCEKAQRELGYSLTPVADAIKDFFDWREKSVID
ncbi:MAG: NAD-dependent epimerase/dehydratase family protein [Bacteroidales bacterium]|nr:NAD-dependent epimerase/dehydratase family protein [Bacteroidales bacterium]